MSFQLSPHLRRRIRFNIQEIQSALRARDISVSEVEIARMSVADLILILADSEISLPIGDYNRPFFKQHEERDHSEDDAT